MKKRLHITLKNGQENIIDEENIEGNIQNQIITFSFQNMHHTLDLAEESFLRENDDYAFFLDIQNQKSEITLKKEQYNLQVLVEYANLLKNKNEMKISYFIETDNNENVLTISWKDDEESD